eukprot:jgi/Mesvir1/15068/Mv14716-RA.2
MTDILVASVQSNAQLFVVSAVGVIAGQAGLLHTKFLRDASRLSLAVFSPAFVLAMTKYYGLDQLWRWLPLPLISFATIFIGAGMAKVGSMMMGLDPDDTCMAVVSTAFVNTGAVPFVLIDGLLKTWEPLEHAQPGTRERAYAMIMVYTVPWYFMIYSFGIQYMNRHAVADSDDESDGGKSDSEAGASPKRGGADAGPDKGGVGGEEGAAAGDPGNYSSSGGGTDGLRLETNGMRSGGTRALPSIGEGGNAGGSAETGGSASRERVGESRWMGASGTLVPVNDPLPLPPYLSNVAGSEYELSSRPSDTSTSTREMVRGGEESSNSGPSSVNRASMPGGGGSVDGRRLFEDAGDDKSGGADSSSSGGGGILRTSSAPPQGEAFEEPGPRGYPDGERVTGLGPLYIKKLPLGRASLDSSASDCNQVAQPVNPAGQAVVGRKSQVDDAPSCNGHGTGVGGGAPGTLAIDVGETAPKGGSLVDARSTGPAGGVDRGSGGSSHGKKGGGKLSFLGQGGGSSRGYISLAEASVSNKRSVRRVLRKLWAHTEKALLRIWHHKMVSPPNIALVVGVTIASTPFLNSLFLTPSSPLRFCLNAATLLSGGSVPLSTLILAGSLSQMLTSYMHRRKRQRAEAAGELEHTRTLARLDSMPATPLPPNFLRSHGYFAYFPFARSISLPRTERRRHRTAPDSEDESHSHDHSMPLVHDDHPSDHEDDHHRHIRFSQQQRQQQTRFPQGGGVPSGTSSFASQLQLTAGNPVHPPGGPRDDDSNQQGSAPLTPMYTPSRPGVLRGGAGRHQADGHGSVDGHEIEHADGHHDHHNHHHRHHHHHSHQHHEGEIDMPSAKLTFLICFLRLIVVPIVMMALVVLAERLGMLEGSGTKLTLMLVLLLECCSPSAQTLIILYQVNGQSQAAGKLAFIYLVMVGLHRDVT